MSVNVHLTNVENVATADAVANDFFIDVIGNKIDVSNDAGTASIVALLRYIIANLSSDTDVAALIGALNTAAASGAVDNATTVMAYLKQVITEGIARDILITALGTENDVAVADAVDNFVVSDIVGNKADTTATGAISATKSLMAYVKQLVTEGITRDIAITAIETAHDVAIPDAATNLVISDVVGNKTDAATTGAVSAVASLAAYVKQLVTEGIARDTAIGAIDDLLDVPTEDLATDATINQAIGKKSDTVAGTSLIALTKQNAAAIAVVDGLMNVPSEDLATDDTINQVVGKKTDTVAGTSLISLQKVANATLVFPTEDLVTDATIAQVVGKKSDTVAGTSIVAIAKQNAAALVVIDAFHDVAGSDSAANLTMSDVIGDKTDTNAGDSLYANILIPTADAVTNVNTRDVIGNKADAAALGVVSAEESLMAYAKQNVTNTEAIDALTITMDTKLDTIDNFLDTEIADIKTETDQIGTMVNAGGTATIGGIFGDFANVTLVSRLDSINGYLDTEIADIKAIIDALPDVGALTTINTAVVTTIPAFLAFPTEDLATDATIAQVVGKKSDTVAGTSLVAITKQNAAAIAALANVDAAAINAEVVDVVVTDNKLDKLIAVDDRTAAAAFPDSVVDESVLNFIMSKTLDNTSYDYATDSLEAISDLITGQNDISTSNVNTEVDLALNTIIPAAPAAGSLNDILSIASGGNTFDKATDSLEAIRNRIDTINTADQIDLDAIIVDTTAIIADLDNATDGLGALKTLIDANQTDADAIIVDTTAIIADLDNATDGLGALKTLIDANQTDLNTVITSTGTTIPNQITGLNNVSTTEVNTEVDSALNTIVPASPTVGSLNDILSKAAGGNTFDKATDSLEAIRDIIDTINTADQIDLDAILEDTAVIGALGGGLTSLGGMSVGMQAEINIEVDTALNTIVPASPTAGSLNDVLSKAAGSNTFDKATDSLEAIRDIIDTNNTADQIDLDAILADTILIGGIDAATTDSVHGKIGTDTEMLDRSLADILWLAGIPTAFPAAAAPAADVSIGAVIRELYDGLYTDATGASVAVDLINLKAETVSILADTLSISGGTLPVDPTAGSLATFIASGGTALGTALAASKSIIDALGTDGTTAAVATAASPASLFGAIGTNETDVTTTFTSAAVEPNVDGTVLERLEHLAVQLLASGDIHDVLYADAAGASLAVDIAANQTDLDAIIVGTITNATGADVATDVVAIQADVTAGIPQTATVVTADASVTPWTVAAHRLFTVTGVVKVHEIFAVVDETVVEGAGADNTISVGTLDDVDLMIGAIAGDTLVTDDILANVAGGSLAKHALVTNAESFLVSSSDIDLDVLGTNSITDGTLTFYCTWTPISSGATLVAAVWD